MRQAGGLLTVYWGQYLRKVLFSPAGMYRFTVRAVWQVLWPRIPPLAASLAVGRSWLAFLAVHWLWEGQQRALLCLRLGSFGLNHGLCEALRWYRARVRAGRAPEENAQKHEC